MRFIFTHIFCVFAFIACVPVAKYNTVQHELINSQNEVLRFQSDNITLASKLDSTKNSTIALKSDYNSLSFELAEIQRYAAFTNRDIKQINTERAEYKALLYSVNQAQARTEHSAWISNERANSFSKDVKCELSFYTSNNFLLTNKNIVLLDLEGLMGASIENQAELKKALVDLMKPLQKRTDWNMRVCLYQGGLQPEWNKITLQNEVMGFFVMEAKLPSNKVQSVTRIISNEGNVEFGFADKSRLFVEFEFNG
jgi:hypothetical protein